MESKYLQNISYGRFEPWRERWTANREVRGAVRRESVAEKGAASNESNGKKREASGSVVQPNSKRARKDEEKPLRIKLSLKSKASGEKTSATKAASNASSPARKPPAKKSPSAARKKGEEAEKPLDAAVAMAAESTVGAMFGSPLDVYLIAL